MPWGMLAANEHALAHVNEPIRHMRWRMLGGANMPQGMLTLPSQSRALGLDAVQGPLPAGG